MRHFFIRPFPNAEWANRRRSTSLSSASATGLLLAVLSINWIKRIRNIKYNDSNFFPALVRDAPFNRTGNDCSCRNIYLITGLDAIDASLWHLPTEANRRRRNKLGYAFAMTISRVSFELYFCFPIRLNKIRSSFDWITFVINGKARGSVGLRECSAIENVI